MLRSLGVEVRGKRPRIDRAGAWVGGEVVSFTHHLRTGVSDRFRVAKAMGGLGRSSAADWAGRPVAEWIDDVTDDPAGRLVLASLIRTTTYSADTSLLDAGAATAQLRAALRGVLYLHGGWSSLVAALADVVRAHGGVVLTGTPAAGVEHDDEVRAVCLADGRTLPAAAVIVAVNDPRRAAGLLDGEAAARLGSGRERSGAGAHGPPRPGDAAVAVAPVPRRARHRRSASS